ncbi:DNA polymerase III subunit delta' C-terminal domain-containing protein [Buchnera aphidicola]|uniref:DNA polymerase III subunit delta' C-terminal domain-containing protein n=1 Tax=Buchnera aphidicola TaxID=9 RepID=UPI0031B81BBE
MQNKLYPWLSQYYIKIINMIKKRQHSAVMLNSDNNIGINKLILNIKKWIFCKNIQNEYACNKCKECMLINENKNFDIYNINLLNKIKINEIRKIIEKILLTSKSCKKKIIYIKHSEFITELESNTLLKIIEEPPKNTIFFLQTSKIKNIISTLKSRLYIVNIINPKKNTSIKWLLKNTNFNKKICEQAIKISNNVPLFAIKMLNSNLWKIRKHFYAQLFYIIKNEKLLNIIKIIQRKEINFLLNLIYTIFLDAIKYKKNILKFIINTDQKKLIKMISKKFKKKIIFNSIISWIQFEKNLFNIDRVNYDLILLEQVFKWNKILKN